MIVLTFIIISFDGILGTGSLRQGQKYYIKTEYQRCEQEGHQLCRKRSAIQAAQTEPREEMEPIGAKSSFDEEDLEYQPEKPVLSDKERMEIQLREYRKLVRLQEEIL